MNPEAKTQLISPRTAWNKARLNELLSKHNIRSQWPLVTDQLPSVVIKGLEAGSYNPSIIRFNGKLVMVYRFHPEETLVTRLGVAELDENFNVTYKQVLEINDDNMSHEDGRLFELQGELWLSYVSSSWPTFPSCSHKYVRLSKPDHWRCDSPVEHHYKERDSLEKNHLPIPFGDKLYVLYRSQPKQIVYLADSREERISEPLKWPYGEIRGGTVPLPYKGNLLRFFHSSLRNEMPPVTWRYYLACVVMEPEPPFKMLAISKRPIARGSEIGGDETRKHFKANVIFPMGAIEHNGGFCVSVGVNDSACVVLKLQEKDLNL